MSIYYVCEPLGINVNFLFRQHKELLEVLLFDYDCGVLLHTLSIPLLASAFCAYLKTSEFPWLFQFLTDNKIASATGRWVIYHGQTCREFNFMEEIFYESQK